MSRIIEKRLNTEPLQTIGATIHDDSTTSEPQPSNGHQTKQLGTYMHCTGAIFALDSAVVKTHKTKLSSHRGLLTFTNVCNA